LLGAAGVCLAAAAAHGQGLIIERRPPRPEIRPIQPVELRELNVDATIREQVADVRVTQRFYNPSPVQLEAELLFPLPEDGAIQDFVLMVDGQEITGRILPREEARRTYEEIVRTRRDPALLEFAGHGLYRTSVFPVPARAERTVTMRYTHVLRRDGPAVEFTYPLAATRVAGAMLPKFEVNVRIDSREAIKSIYSPSHADLLKIERRGDREARAGLNEVNASAAADLRLIYTLEPGPVGATVLSWRPEGSGDGYFLLLASPEVKAADERPAAKTVIFVLDRSGSMSGKKIEQARGALSFVLDNLRENDLFNIVAYDAAVESFKPELQRYTPAMRDEARRFIDNIRAGGSTNIDEALGTALGMIHDDSSPAYVIFLTDGLPTAGERNELKIAENAKGANKYRARVFSFGVGFDVNARLLDRLSTDHTGTTEFVKPDEDIEEKVGRFYSKMSSPVLTDIKLAMDGVDLNRIYPRELPDLFAGGQLVAVGRYVQSRGTTVRLTGRVGERDQAVESRIELASPGEGRRYEYLERIWASRRIGTIINEIDLKGQNDELREELIALSKRYGILTPYTSFLADERVANVALLPRSGGGRGRRGGADYFFAYDPSNGTDSNGDVYRLKSDERLLQLGAIAGESGQAQREYQGALAGNAQIYDRDSLSVIGGVGSGRGGRRGRAGAGAGASAAPATIMSGSLADLPAVQTGAARGEPVQLIRQQGARTFFNRNGAWVESVLGDEDEKGAQRVEQFSDAYFKLVESLPAESVQYLAFREPVVVRLQGQVYRIEPPAE
jgi:Ca-activated chloride channel family protein